MMKSHEFDSRILDTFTASNRSLEGRRVLARARVCVCVWTGMSRGNSLLAPPQRKIKEGSL
jgi:hypothetical protein